MCNNQWVLLTSAYVWILSVHHLTCDSDWPSAGEYEGCTSCAFSEYLHYSLHPPSSDKIRFNPNHEVQHANIMYAYTYHNWLIKKSNISETIN